MKTKLQYFTNQYVAVWNEADAGKQHGKIETFWVVDGSHFKQARAFIVHDQFDKRIEETHREFVRDKTSNFDLCGGPSGRHVTVKNIWQMVDSRSSGIIALGSTVLRLDENEKTVSERRLVEPLSLHA